MNLTDHFTLEELTHSEAATRKAINNKPPSDVLPKLITLAQGLEKVRSLLGVPVIISSGYRSPAVNQAVGGSRTSAHCEGRAADFIAPKFGDPKEVAKAIRDSDIQFDQIIHEGGWVHIAFGGQERRQVLTAHFNGGPATYTEGIA